MKYKYLVIAVLGLLCLSMISLFVGVSDVSLTSLWTGSAIAQDVFFISRLPRTIALLLVGSAMAVSGLIMQLLTQNRFVEPSLVGTTQSANFGVLFVLVVLPSASIMTKMIVACGFALLGTIVFMLLLRRIIVKSALTVPLVGMMLSAVIGAMTVFFAMYFDLLQAMGSWMNGDFSGVLKGRYELLWGVALLILIACWIADSLTVVGMGHDFSVNVGLDYRRIMLFGMAIVAIISGIVVVVVGMLPFLGLIVPNLVSLIMGDNIRRTLPWVCLSGGGLALICDIIGRLVCYPFEVPVSVILGVVGAIVLLFLLFNKQSYAKY